MHGSFSSSSLAYARIACPFGGALDRCRPTGQPQDNVERQPSQSLSCCHRPRASWRKEGEKEKKREKGNCFGGPSGAANHRSWTLAAASRPLALLIRTLASRLSTLKLHPPSNTVVHTNRPGFRCRVSFKVADRHMYGKAPANRRRPPCQTRFRVLFPFTSSAIRTSSARPASQPASQPY
ncbi:hypothetical protein BKA80DRAFT_273087 [Phyllosticta citrichinensis]